MKECLNCGKAALSNNDTFCGFCGGTLAEVKMKYCLKCGFPIDPVTGICENCIKETETHEAESFDEAGREFIDRSIASTKERKNKDKILTIVLITLIVICSISIVVLCTTLFFKNKDQKGETPTVTSGQSSSTNSGTEDVTDEDIDPSTEVVPEEEPQDQKKILPDYDPDNDDWYRIRKSKDDKDSQLGAYKIAEKALRHAAAYASQGYHLYDKDFNVININDYDFDRSNTEIIEEEPEYTDVETTPSATLQDYAPDSDDW